MPRSTPTLRDLAKTLGLAHSTVSMALRNHPAIAQATRERVQQAAEACGYAPNPLISSLLTQVKARRVESRRMPLAMLSLWPCAWTELLREPVWLAYIQGAERRAAELGYYMEPFCIAGANGVPLHRLEGILRSRNIRGLFIPPVMWDYIATQKLLPELISLLNNVASVTVGYSLIEPILSRTTPDHYLNAMAAFQKMRELGHRRIGIAISEFQDWRTDRRWSAAAEAFNHSIPSEERIPPLRMPMKEGHISAREWYEDYHPGVIAVSEDSMARVLETIGAPIGRDVLLVHLDWNSTHYDCPGIDQLPAEVGAIAIEILINQVERGESGLPAIRRMTSVEGVWRERGPEKAAARDRR